MAAPISAKDVETVLRATLAREGYQISMRELCYS
jgi:hypothetical protein